MDIKDRLLKSKEEFLSRHFWKSLRCELIGTLNVEISLSFGLTEIILIKCLGHTSGGHFNPAVTISMLCARHISFIRALSYIFVQFLGALIGGGILFGMIPTNLQGTLGVTLLSNDINKGQAFGIEFMATFIFVFVYFSTLQPNNDTIVPESTFCGVAVCLSCLFSVYWVGPILGGIIGGFTFEYTKDSSNHFENFRRSLRQRVYSLRGKEDCASTNSIATELTCEHDVGTEEVQ
ncbi:hypothetical protein KUTeg_019198, partial [Tegillarca granosa]